MRLHLCKVTDSSTDIEHAMNTSSMPHAEFHTKNMLTTDESGTYSVTKFDISFLLQ